MKTRTKTSNAQRSTPNIEWTPDGIRIKVGRLKTLGEAENLTLCLNEVDQLIRIFAASVKTAKKNAK